MYVFNYLILIEGGIYRCICIYIYIYSFFSVFLIVVFICKSVTNQIKKGGGMGGNCLLARGLLRWWVELWD